MALKVRKAGQQEHTWYIWPVTREAMDDDAFLSAKDAAHEVLLEYSELTLNGLVPQDYFVLKEGSEELHRLTLSIKAWRPIFEVSAT